MSDKILHKELNIDNDNVAPSCPLNGLLVTYKGDQLNERVRSAIKRKSRVRYKCMDTFANFLAFGTTGGAIYLYKLKSINHSSCSLTLMIPCDQGSIEVIKFLPNPQTDDLLVTIGTARGSLVIFRLTQSPDDENPTYDEIYRAESFTNNYGIKLIECDQDLIDLTCPFTKLYICDLANRLYVLESSTIYANRQSLRLFYTSHLPCLIFSVNDSKINQISVHRSQLLISTDETTRLFNEQSNQLNVIGKKKRKEGFYGACFYNPSYKPLRILQLSPNDGQNTAYSSTNSLSEMENLYIFVSRPMFRLWQVNNRREVMFTHQFEPLIKANAFKSLINLSDEPLRNDDDDDPSAIIDHFTKNQCEEETTELDRLRGDHFEKLVQIYSSTLGNLLLSHNQHELFVVDPIEAKLIVYHIQKEPIIQVCCNENELFLWSLAIDGDSAQFQVTRLVLMATTQFVLELHRIHRYTTIVMFIELFSELFRQRLALPLSGTNTITTEGGLLRNVLLNAWDLFVAQAERSNREPCVKFEKIIEEIIDESKQLRRSFEDMSDSRFFLNMTNDNIDRLCTEPYASLVSLEVSIKDLHTTHVIHFNKDALERHKSAANLSQSIQNLSKTNRRIASSNFDINKKVRNTVKNGSLQQLSQFKSIAGSRVRVEEDMTERSQQYKETTANHQALPALHEQKLLNFNLESLSSKLVKPKEKTEEEQERERQRMIKSKRCPDCHWPRPASHLLPLDSSQKIQLNWLEENLMSRFEDELEQIRKHSFNHGLWHIYLKTLAYKKQFEDYISFCMMLDDIRMLKIEYLNETNEEELFNRILEHISENISLITSEVEEKCLKCGKDFKALDAMQSDPNCQEEMTNDNICPQKFSFNVVNLFEKFMKRKEADIKNLIASLRKYPIFLNHSKIPSAFYLKAIASATLVANQTPLNKARLNQLHHNNNNKI